MLAKRHWIFQGSMRRTLMSLLLIIFAPLLLVQLGIYYAWFQTQLKNNAEDNLETARAIAKTMSAVIRGASSHELALGSVILRSEPNMPKLEKLLKISADEDPTIRSFSWVLPDGQVTITSEPNKAAAAITDTAYFKGILAGQDLVVSSFMANEKLSGVPAIVIARAIRGERGLLQGIIVGSISEQEFHNVIAPLRPSTISSILIFDRHGTLIYRWPEVPLTLNQRAAWVGQDTALLLALAGKDAAGYFASPISGEEEVTARVPVGDTGLVVGVAHAETKIILPIVQNILFNLSIVSLVMAISLVVARSIGLKILHAVLRLREHARAIGRGDLEHRADVGGITELQELTDEFNKMALQLKERKEQVEQTVDELKRSNQDLEQFAYVASHDLQEPLRAVAGFVGLLKFQLQDHLDAKRMEYMNFVVDGVARMQLLINGLLEFSRVGTRGKTPEPTSSKIALEHAISHLQVSIKKSGAKIITAESLPMVTVDSVQLVQLFQNLIGNAIKFRSDQPPEISISVKRLARAWQFAVADNGIGIDPQYFDRIFLIFQRLHTQDKYPGTGIGLAICRKIVERHGGKIWVESKPGNGSTFYFTIPDGG